YFLIAGKQQGRRIATLESPAKPINAGSFAFTTERRDRTLYFSALLNGERENFFGSLLTSQPLNQSLTVEHLDSSASQNGSLEVTMQGVTAFPHSIFVQLNDVTLGSLNFSGQANVRQSFPVAASLLRDGENIVKLRNTGNPADVSLVDTLRLTYPHQYTANQNKLSCTVTGGQPLTISGFTDKTIHVFDVTRPESVQELRGAIEENRDSYTISLQVPGNGTRSLLAVTDSTSNPAAQLSRYVSSTLRDDSKGAELVILTAHDLLPQAEGLKAIRRAQGLSVAVVEIEAVFNEFSFGQKTPYAIKKFLNFAKKSWRVPARYVLLFGDASYDAKNYLRLD